MMWIALCYSVYRKAHVAPPCHAAAPKPTTDTACSFASLIRYAPTPPRHTCFTIVCTRSLDDVRGRRTGTVDWLSGSLRTSQHSAALCAICAFIAAVLFSSAVALRAAASVTADPYPPSPRRVHLANHAEFATLVREMSACHPCLYGPMALPGGC